MLLHIVLLLVGFLFILDFPLRKPSLKAILAIIGVTLFTVIMISMYTRFKLPSQTDETNPIFEEIMGELYETETP